MLIEFRVENHRSLRDEQALTMQVGRGGHPNDPRRRVVAGYSKCLLPAAALYGANASGKSNVLSALGFMRDAVIDSHASWPPHGGVPRDAFAWGQRAGEPSMFEATLLARGVRYQYGFVVDQLRVLEEWLYAWPQRRRQIWLEREGDSFSFGHNLRGENRRVEQVTRSNALFLSTAAQHRHRQLLPIHAWFQELRAVRVEGYRERYADAMPAAAAASMFAAFAAAAAATPNGMVRLSELVTLPGTDGALPEGLSKLGDAEAEELRSLLRAADVGIADFRTEAASSDENTDGKRPPKVLMLHRPGSADAWLPLERESAGTRALFHLGPLVIEALGRGSMLVVDELEASLHPSLGLRIVKLFNDPGTNPRNAQLLFTTHNTKLLGTTVGEATLRRDQVWLTEKDDSGATTIYPLTDYKPRKAENLERGYLQGRYGAIPFLGDLVGRQSGGDG